MLLLHSTSATSAEYQTSICHCTMHILSRFEISVQIPAIGLHMLYAYTSAYGSITTAYFETVGYTYIIIAHTTHKLLSDTIGLRCSFWICHRLSYYGESCLPNCGTVVTFYIHVSCEVFFTVFFTTQGGCSKTQTRALSNLNLIATAT